MEAARADRKNQTVIRMVDILHVAFDQKDSLAGRRRIARKAASSRDYDDRRVHGGTEEAGVTAIRHRVIRDGLDFGGQLIETCNGGEVQQLSGMERVWKVLHGGCGIGDRSHRRGPVTAAASRIIARGRKFSCNVGNRGGVGSADGIFLNGQTAEVRATDSESVALIAEVGRSGVRARCGHRRGKIQAELQGGHDVLQDLPASVGQHGQRSNFQRLLSCGGQIEVHTIEK